VVIRFLALATVGRIDLQDVGWVEQLERHLEDAQLGPVLLGHVAGMGPQAKPAISVLIRALRNPRLYPHAAMALGRIGAAAKEAVPELLRWSEESTDPVVLWSAWNALRGVGLSASEPVVHKLGTKALAAKTQEALALKAEVDRLHAMAKASEDLAADYLKKEMFALGRFQQGLAIGTYMTAAQRELDWEAVVAQVAQISQALQAK